MPIIGADFLQHFGQLVDLGEMRLLARKGGWSQHLVTLSSSGLFATIGVVADQALMCQEKGAPRSGSGCTCGDFNFISHSGGTIFSFISIIGGTWWQLFSSARAGEVPQGAQHLQGAAQANTLNAALPGHSHSHRQVQEAGQQQAGGCQEGVC